MRFKLCRFFILTTTKEKKNCQENRFLLLEFETSSQIAFFRRQSNFFWSWKAMNFFWRLKNINSTLLHFESRRTSIRLVHTFFVLQKWFSFDLNKKKSPIFNYSAFAKLEYLNFLKIKKRFRDSLENSNSIFCWMNS